MPTVKEVINRSLKHVRGHIAVAIWQRADVIDKAREMGIQLGVKAADEILDTIDNKQDCEYGISWGTLESFIDSWKEDHPHYRRCNSEEDGE